MKRTGAVESQPAYSSEKITLPEAFDLLHKDLLEYKCDLVAVGQQILPYVGEAPELTEIVDWIMDQIKIASELSKDLNRKRINFSASAEEVTIFFRQTVLEVLSKAPAPVAKEKPVLPVAEPPAGLSELLEELSEETREKALPGLEGKEKLKMGYFRDVWDVDYGVARSRVIKILKQMGVEVEPLSEGRRRHFEFSLEEAIKMLIIWEKSQEETEHGKEKIETTGEEDDILDNDPLYPKDIRSFSSLKGKRL